MPSFYNFKFWVWSQFVAHKSGLVYDKYVHKSPTKRDWMNEHLSISASDHELYTEKHIHFWESPTYNVRKGMIDYFWKGIVPKQFLQWKDWFEYFLSQSRIALKRKIRQIGIVPNDILSKVSKCFTPREIVPKFNSIVCENAILCFKNDNILQFQIIFRMFI